MVKLLCRTAMLVLLAQGRLPSQSPPPGGPDPPASLASCADIIGVLDEDEREALRDLADAPLFASEPRRAPGTADTSARRLWKARLLVRMSRSGGPDDRRDDSVFPGALAAVTAKLGLRLGADLQAGVTAVRERGERWGDACFAGTVGYGGKGLRLLIGDFTFGAAEGLVFPGSGSRPGRRRTGITDDDLAACERLGSEGSMRGIALAVSIPSGSVTAGGTVLISRRGLDASLHADGSVSGFEWYARDGPPPSAHGLER